ncbi:thiol:disulfide interchange protein DsbA/DsbL [Azonexus sp.]|uniref:thiol:disulfide interchange protein DsbA/DsbL n=1 Tax=Azonexus sp. TaxID=1872668 RepID=UPI0035B153A4
MKFDRRHFIGSVFALAALSTAPAFAQTAGRDYTAIVPPQPSEEAGKIEVLEFFSYGCPHCADFNPLLSAWAAKLPADVVLKKVPVTFGRAAWANIARLFYTLEILGETARLEADVFRAIQNERVNLFDEKTLNEWIAKKGVDTKKFADTFSSFGVQSRVRRADQMAQAYKITGVPALAVDGKYLVGGKDFGEALAITDKLIARARAERKK